MELYLDATLAQRYISKSQIARVLTEAWFHENMYCPACPSDYLERLQANTKVLDFQCPRCRETFQLKSKSDKFGSTVANSEYYTKVEKIKRGLSPNWALLQYDCMSFKINNLFIIPRHFMTLDAVQKRNPLSNKAERKGWVGSNILLKRLPPDARLYIIDDSQIILKGTVRNGWHQFEFLRKKRLDTKGWLNDVLTCVRGLGKRDFTLQETYGFEDRLQALHPNNKFVKDKIRQQLQLLRDNDILEFVSRGRYRLRI